MTNLNGSRMTEILPAEFSSEPEIQAFSYAIGKQLEKLCDYADGAKTYAAIASLPDKMLDILAVELRTPAYSETYSTEVKRALIKDTLSFYMTMGTPAAVNKIIRTIFKSGYIKEWFEYAGSPYHFKAYTDNPLVTIDNVGEFQTALTSVKRLSAWLDEVVLLLSTAPAQMYVATWIHTGDFITLKKATM